MGTQASPIPTSPPTQPKVSGETRGGILGWLDAKPRALPAPGTQGPACQGRTGPKLSKARPPPAARLADCRGPCSGSASPAGRAVGARPTRPTWLGPRPDHVLLQNRQTSFPMPPRLFIFSLLDRSPEVKGTHAQT